MKSFHEKPDPDSTRPPALAEIYHKTTRPLSAVPNEIGFRFIVTLYDGRELTALVAKDDANRIRWKNEADDTWLLTPKGILWNSIKGWREAP
jgi:hypothetical protein